MISKRHPFHAAAALLIGLAALVSCAGDPGADTPEEGSAGTASGRRTYPSHTVDITVGGSASDGSTRSMVSIDDDAVEKAAVFVFDRATGYILLGDGGKPYATERDSGSFSWALPYDPSGPLETNIYTICNYGDTGLPVTDPNLKEEDLRKLTYSIRTIDELKSMPMAGVSAESLTAQTKGVTLAVDKLYASFHVNFDLSDVRAAGYEIDALYLTTHSVNTTVHWFRPEGGDRATSTTNLDRANSVELRLMEDGASAYVYVLENMQGTITGASSWRDVQRDLGPKVADCTYIDLGVKVRRGDRSWQNCYFNIYLTDGDIGAGSSFDIPRNVTKTIRIRIPANGISVNDPDGLVPDYPTFLWTTGSLDLEPGGSARAEFVSHNIPLADMAITAGDPRLSVSDVRLEGNGRGSCLVTASGQAGESFGSYVLGGDPDAKTRDDLPVTVTKAGPVVTYGYDYVLSPASASIKVGGRVDYSITLHKSTYTDGALTGTEDIPLAASEFTWASDKASVVTVSDGVARGLKAGTATVTATRRGDESVRLTASVTVSDDITYKDRYEISPTTSSVKVGGTQAYTVRGYRDTYTNGERTGTETISVSASDFSWSSDKTGVATVSGGTAKGVAAGSATITAALKSDTSVRLQAKLTVDAPSVTHEYSYTITPESSTIKVGGTQSYTVKCTDVTYTDGVKTNTETYTVTSGISWKSSATSVATVSGGTATGKGSGTATITATVDGKSVTSTLRVEDVVEHKYSYEISPASAAIDIGGTQTYTVTRIDETWTNGVKTGTETTTVGNGSVMWKSSSAQVATVSGGTATGKAAGTATITATVGGASLTSTLKVTDPYTYEYWYELDPSSSTIKVGGTQKYTVTGHKDTYKNGVKTGTETFPVTSGISWKSSATSVATVSGGVATGKGSGTATITATVDGKSATSTLKVEDVVEHRYSYEISPASATIDIGGTQSYTVTRIDETWTNGVKTGTETTTVSNGSVTWKSSSAQVATVSGGTATGKAAGTATITATVGGASLTSTLKVTDPYTYEYWYELDPSSSTIKVGGTQKYTVTGHKDTYKNGVKTGTESFPVTSGISWKSSAPSVATVSSGTATGKGSGTATITATVGGKDATATLRVEDVVTYQYRYEMTPESASLEIGETQTFTVKGYKDTYTNGERTGTETVSVSASDFSWSSDKTGVATVSGGTATAAGEGTATITAARKGDSSVTLTATVTVTKPADVITYSLVVTGGGRTSHYEEQRFRATLVTYTNGAETSRRDVTSTAGWTSDWSSATISDGVLRSAYHNRDKGTLARMNVKVTATYTVDGTTCSASGYAEFAKTYNVETTVVTQKNVNSDLYYYARTEYKSGGSYVTLPVRVSSAFSVTFNWSEATSYNQTSFWNVTATGESGSQYSEWYRWDEHQSNYVTGVFASGATTRTWDNKTVFYEDSEKEYYYFR